MKERDPGNAPQVNDRIPSVIIYKEKKLLQADATEHPSYVIENKLEIDYLHYLTNQIMNPTIQFLELIIDNPKKIFDEYINREELKRKKIQPLDKWINSSNTNSWDNLDYTIDLNNLKKKNRKKSIAEKIYSLPI
jgi:DNA polymerase elongation subunit (family B)